MSYKHFLPLKKELLISQSNKITAWEGLNKLPGCLVCTTVILISSEKK